MSTEWRKRFNKPRVPDTIPEHVVLEKSHAAFVEDQKHLEWSDFHYARREVIIQLDAIHPDVERIKHHLLDVLEKKGSDGFFERDPHTDLSIADALEANKNLPGKQEAVSYVAGKLEALINKENTHAATVKQRKDDLAGLKTRG